MHSRISHQASHTLHLAVRYGAGRSRKLQSPPGSESTMTQSRQIPNLRLPQMCAGPLAGLACAPTLQFTHKDPPVPTTVPQLYLRSRRDTHIAIPIHQLRRRSKTELAPQLRQRRHPEFSSLSLALMRLVKRGVHQRRTRLTVSSTWLKATGRFGWRGEVMNPWTARRRLRGGTSISWIDRWCTLHREVAHGQRRTKGVRLMCVFTTAACICTHRL